MNTALSGLFELLKSAAGKTVKKAVFCNVFPILDKVATPRKDLH